MASTSSAVSRDIFLSDAVGTGGWEDWNEARRAGGRRMEDTVEGAYPSSVLGAAPLLASPMHLPDVAWSEEGENASSRRASMTEAGRDRSIATRLATSVAATLAWTTDSSWSDRREGHRRATSEYEAFRRVDVLDGFACLKDTERGTA